MGYPPWGNIVTLCIAAACQDRDKARIILCSDTKVEAGVAGAEIEDKLRCLVPGWPALLAGNLAKAEELVDFYTNYLNPRRLTEKNIIMEFKKPAYLFKRHLANEYTQKTLGLSYDQFLRIGKRVLPERQFERILEEIEYQTYGRLEPESCSLLFCGFLKGDSYIFKVASDGTSVYVEHFEVIGVGAYVALPALYQRKHYYDVPLEQAIYHVYEAKKLGEIVPGVGKDTRIDIIGPNRQGRTKEQLKSVNADGMALLKERYKRLGLKPVPDKIGFNKKHFEIS